MRCWSVFFNRFPHLSQATHRHLSVMTSPIRGPQSFLRASDLCFLAALPKVTISTTKVPDAFLIVLPDKGRAGLPMMKGCKGGHGPRGRSRVGGGGLVSGQRRERPLLGLREGWCHTYGSCAKAVRRAPQRLLYIHVQLFGPFSIVIHLANNELPL